VVVRETDPPEPELSISPVSISRAPRLELLSAMTGTVAAELGDWGVLLALPASKLVLLLLVSAEDAAPFSIVSGEVRQGLEKNANAR
jgi:hypothetical protein